MTVFFDQDEFGDPHAVSARHRALVLVDEALGTDPCFSWRVDLPGGPLANWRGEDGSHYLGRFEEDGAVLWGSDADACGPAPLGSVVPDRYRVVIDSYSPGPAPAFCVWWDGTQWSGEVPRPALAERVIGPLLGDDAAAEWVDWHHGLPDLVEPLLNFLAVVAAGIPMTPHALVAFTDNVDELDALMRRAAELGLGAVAGPVDLSRASTTSFPELPVIVSEPGTAGEGVVSRATVDRVGAPRANAVAMKDVDAGVARDRVAAAEALDAVLAASGADGVRGARADQHVVTVGPADVGGKGRGGCQGN